MMSESLHFVFRRQYACFIILTCGLLLGCDTGESTQTSGGDPVRMHVAVSILPQAEFVHKIAGETVEVVVMVPPGASPATYEPKPQQIKSLAGCAAYFTIGVPFEDAWLGRMRSAQPELLLVDTAAGIQRLPMATHQHHEEEAPSDPGSDGDHYDAGDHPDPHIWLSPRLVKIQAAHIERTLSSLSPENSGRFQAALMAFSEELDQLDAEIRGKLSRLKNQKFMVFHPAWGYFANEYGLEMIPVEVGGQEPSGAELAEFVDIARAEGLKVILAQPEFSTRAVETLAHEIGGRVFLASPMGTPWAENLLKVADAFAQELPSDSSPDESRTKK